MRKIIFFALLATLFATPAFSQGLSPLIQIIHANKKGHATGAFQVVNGTLSPMSTVLEVKGFSLDENGHSNIEDLDNTKIHVALDSMSARIAPQSNHTFTFTADCVGPCQFRILTFDGSAKHIDSGVQVKIVLAETIYVETDPLRQDEVTATWAGNDLVLQNHSTKMARAENNTAGKIQLADFTLEPQSRRILHFDSPPQGVVTIRFEKFEIKSQQ
jgi:hypothetical protein